MPDVTLLGAADPFTAAAEHLAERLRALPRPRLAVSGGSALKTLRLLREHLGPDTWRTVRLTWADERLVPFADAHSSRGTAYREGALLDAQPPALELPLVLDGETASAACARVDASLRADFDGALDVALLGLGEDGHVASLFPGHPALSRTGLVTALDDSPKPPAQRVTLTLPLLARPGLERVIVASGPGKRDAVQRLLVGDDSLPAVRLGPVTVFTDL